MNLANKLTVSRVVLVFVFMATLLLPWSETMQLRLWVSLGVFSLASFTDFLDGYIARSQNLITDFGKFADPLADKMLVTAAMVALIEIGPVPAGNLPAWIVITILIREFTISGVRIIAASKNVVIAASWWGKIKTNFQIFMIIILLIPVANVYIKALATFLIYGALISTVISGVEYILKNKEVFGKDI
ncbi:MAG TPA: CDP-diacylglycerol--glycerol-3-phosphate 3-phosphatidyltransferase [Epulopiscium sp.]|nr:CDP-diacylglycerol--glycerol-3-phosphate 3-phosphatidyltransferase [Candidatus Epulonipiscium sp.]